ncbi:MAG: SLBB domain-containing protein [Acidobacteria bacterium]|nr:SLBB domain-containing protein [Acidobacteriota bacterium]
MAHARRAVAACAAAVLVAACALAAGVATAGQDDTDRADAAYTIGPRDVLSIRVFNQADLSGPYTVEADGAVSFPLIGRIAASELTVRAFEQALRDRLAAGYFRNPRVSVSIAEYRSQRVFIVGEARQPGVFPLTGVMGVIELLALAGGTTPLASGEVVVVRAGTPAGGPVLPDDPADAAALRVDLEAIERGDFSQDVTLRHGDTIFVPRADVVYVFGEVRQPGRYPVRRGTTVLQVLSLAGGGTEFAALNRVRIVRTLDDGEKVELRAALSDVVQPDDIVRVPERFF